MNLYRTVVDRRGDIIGGGAERRMKKNVDGRQYSRVSHSTNVTCGAHLFQTVYGLNER